MALILAAGLVWLGRRWQRRPGRLFAAYVAGYGLGRLWVEALRIDPSNTIAGFRINIWMRLAAILAGTVAMLWPDRVVEVGAPAPRSGSRRRRSMAPDVARASLLIDWRGDG